MAPPAVLRSREKTRDRLDPARAPDLPGEILWGRASGLKIVFYQHGNFREALDHFAAGGAETYRDQRLSVGYVEQLAERHQVTVVAMCGEAYDDSARPGLRLVGLSDPTAFKTDQALEFLRQMQPDRLIARSPHAPLLRAAARLGVPTLPSLADSFRRGGPRSFVRRWRLKGLLQGDHIPCVANHSLNASRGLVQGMGLPADRVVPWDWSRMPMHPVTRGPARAPGAPLHLVYAGGLREAKGLGDLLDAMALAQADGVRTRLTVAGRGEPGPWQARAAKLGLDVDYVGLISHADVVRLMGRGDAVVVPSRLSYPEGLPNTIYEALAARSALILSDHPAFLGRLRDRQEALFFAAENPASLADRLRDLARDPALSKRLAGNAATALEGLYVGLEWPDLITRFVDDPTNQTGWVAPHSLHGLGLA
ncbi:MAG: glycosyltransferase family 4 protein [Pseudomonadota bacterium]